MTTIYRVYSRVWHWTFCFSFALSSYLNVMFTHGIQQGGQSVKWMRTRERFYNKKSKQKKNGFWKNIHAWLVIIGQNNTEDFSIKEALNIG